MASQSSVSKLLLPPESFEGYNSQLQAAALKATKNAAFLPADLSFYRSLDRGLAKEADACSDRVLSLANRLLDLASSGDNTSTRAKAKARLQDDDDVADNFRSLVVDTMDQLLERADICLDEFLGLSKPPVTVVDPKQAKQKMQKPQNFRGRLDPVIQHASNLPKPQLKFRRKVDNSDSIPWRPTLQHKYNAQVPLGYDLRDDRAGGAIGATLHPYRYEIQRISYPSRMFQYIEPIQPRSFEDTPFKWVSTSEDLSELLNRLRGAKEIAVDLEYHSYRSYYGFVCLMQVSTREEDWIIDTLLLREELEELNEVFTDPKIVKVFHGAESDIIWLQQDFNLYIVNLFDTYHASKVLEFPRHSLATLMEMYCDFTPDKRYQLADWRIRPLPEEMLHYARSDTHFLLFIYDHLRNALLDRSTSRAQSRAQSPTAANLQGKERSTPSSDPKTALMLEVLRRSEETALRVCEREKYDSEGGTGHTGWDTLARKWNKGALMASERTSARNRIYRQVHAWRDRIAREEDESTGYVLPNRSVFMLAEQPPSNMADLLAMFQHVNSVLRRHLKELLDTIREAEKEESSSTPLPLPVAEDVKLARAMGADTTREMTNSIKTSSQDTVELWKTGKGSLQAPLSSLFGASFAVHRQSKQSSYVASRSALFTDVRSQGLSDCRKRRFLDVIARIQDTIVVTPVAPDVAKPTTNVSSESETELVEIEKAAVAGQVEIPFVPANKRQENISASLEPVMDSIVVVGQAQRKKRKRTKDEGASTKTVQDEVEEFDYSTVSNILDDSSDHEPERPGNTRKRKQKTHGGFDYGNFRAPPKALSQVKSGNQSHTFK